MMRERDTEIADRIKRMVAELNEAMQQATDDGLVVQVHTPEGPSVIGKKVGPFYTALPSITVEIVRPL
ncbi:hypothetical protein [uncultured Nitratireductor sp.]|uniref:hypothetical protein n=1 Tax=uncultured Nitratireductor sp. TaxID=520953 RepID=UPI0026162461|nr:hypothetical protein [uncultured Nitratireductor sp.]